MEKNVVNYIFRVCCQGAYEWRRKPIGVVIGVEYLHATPTYVKHNSFVLKDHRGCHRYYLE